MSNDPLVIFLIAGEPSGDAIGGRLMAEMKALTGGRIRFAGVGGAAMHREGLESIFPMSDLSIMGLVEIVPHIPKLLRRINDTVEKVKEVRPDALVTIDAPAFNFKVARRLKGQGVPLIHYVAPTVWAWRPGRARKIARFLDHLLVLLPFEPPYFEREGLACTFIGHPVIESGADGGDGKSFRRKYQIPDEAPLLCLLPGSRFSEISKLLPVFKLTVDELGRRHPRLRVVVPTVDHVADAIRNEINLWPVPAMIIEGTKDKYDAFAAADVALAASGTVAMELAMAGTPTVIAYKVSRLSAFLARRLVRVSHVNLLNILLGREVVPEHLQERCNPATLANAVSRLLDDPDARTAQKAAALEGMEMIGLGGPSPSHRAAETILKIVEKHRLSGLTKKD
ncbi:MAG: lipid-A-disaccharide synthase [Rhodospirillales bacterium]|nr:lipid-A-disaccharide synthase [Rhodospirillales bacterium]